jgi:hypothetical protein
MTAMHRDREQPTAQRRQSTSVGPAVEDHGRVVTANKEAAAFYRRAQQAADTSGATTSLRLAVAADPTFGLAIADLDALTRTPLHAIGGRPMNWERHHIEVVSTAAGGNHIRAADLLREHLATVGCDPLALSIVTSLRQQAGHPDGIEDLAGPIPGCHRPSFRS